MHQNRNSIYESTLFSFWTVPVLIFVLAEYQILAQTDSCTLPTSWDKSYIIQCKDQQATSVTSGTVPSFCSITVNCLEGYSLGSVNKPVFCAQGEWTSDIPECKKICPKLKVPTENTNIECTLNGKISCDGELLSGTVVKQTCKKHYRSVLRGKKVNIMTCRRNGQWSLPVLGCEADCGKTMYHQTEQIIGGTEERFGDAPWHVAVYRNKTQICGGTLVSERVVISAAHCFISWDNKLQNIAFYDIAVSKIRRDFSSIDNKYQKLYKIKDLHYPNDYRSIDNYFTADVALLVLAEKIKLSDAVLPVCIDLTSADNLADGVKGKVSGWGLTETGKPSIPLLTVELAYSSYATCVASIPNELVSTISFDKFCAGDNSGAEMNSGDSGGGFLVFQRDDNAYYIRGIVSTKGLGEFSRGIFTDVFKHAEFIRGILDKTEAPPEMGNDNVEKSGQCHIPTKEKDNFKFDCEPVYNDSRPNEVYVPNFCQITRTCNLRSENTVWSTCTNGIWKPNIKRCSAQQPNLTVPSASTKICTIPEETINSIYLVSCEGNENVLSKGTVNAGCKLRTYCKQGYILKPGENSEAACLDKSWFPTLPQCSAVPVVQSKCRIPMLENVLTHCYKGKESVNCNGDLLSGMAIVLKCKEYFHPDDAANHTKSWCNENGAWNPPLYRCVPGCGNIYPIQRETGERFGSMPWEAIIRSNSTGSLSGAIITQRIIIFRRSSSAFIPESIAVSNARWPKISGYLVDNKFHRTYKLKKFIKHPDISLGLVVTEEEIELNVAVQLVCIDLSGKLFDLAKHSQAEMAIWKDDKRAQELVTVSVVYNNSSVAGMKAYTTVDFAYGSAILYFKTNSVYYVRGVENYIWQTTGSNITVNEISKSFHSVHYYAEWIKKIIRAEDLLYY